MWLKHDLCGDNRGIYCVFVLLRYKSYTLFSQAQCATSEKKSLRRNKTVWFLFGCSEMSVVNIQFTCFLYQNLCKINFWKKKKQQNSFCQNVSSTIHYRRLICTELHKCKDFLSHKVVLRKVHCQVIDSFTWSLLITKLYNSEDEQNH